MRGGRRKDLSVRRKYNQEKEEFKSVLNGMAVTLFWTGHNLISFSSPRSPFHPAVGSLLLSTHIKMRLRAGYKIGLQPIRARLHTAS